MSLCKICRGAVFDGIHLSDGGVIHESCLESIQGKELEIQNEIYAQQKILNSCPTAWFPYKPMPPHFTITFLHIPQIGRREEDK